MKILLICPHLPGPRTRQAGERLVFELIKHLSRNHEISIVVRVEEDRQHEIGALTQFCRSIHVVPYVRPARLTIFSVPRVVFSYYRLCRKANRLAAREPFDLIQAEWTETGVFLRKQGRTAIQAHDVLSKPMERRYRNARGLPRLLRRILFVMTRMLESRVYAKFGSVSVLSEADKQYLLSLFPSLKVTVLAYPPGTFLSQRAFKRDEKTLLFVGAMDRGTNVEAVLYLRQHILPLVREQVPEVMFIIAGSRPLPEVRKLAENDANTIVTGFVNDLESCYRTATVFVAPLLTGGGMIVKILDALASGTPVVTTSIGNEGINAVPGEHLLVGDTPEIFAHHVVRLLRDKALRERLGKKGRELFDAKYGNEALHKAMDEYYSAGGL